MGCLAWGGALAVLLITPELSKIADGKSWSVINADAETTMEEGARVLRLTPKPADTPSSIGLALVEGVELGEGTVDVDLKGKGRDEASFLGVAFNVSDAKRFEAVYFRPFNFGRAGDKDGQPSRAHAVQYVAWPEHTWEKLRHEKPLAYEAAVAPEPDPSGWFHARVEVTKAKVRVWVDGAKAPCLVVERLGRGAHGKVGLWVDSKDGAFRNLKIRPGK